MTPEILCTILKTVANQQEEVEGKLYLLNKGVDMDIYNKELYVELVNSLLKTHQQLIEAQDKAAMQAFYLIFNDSEKNNKLNITWTVDNSHVLIDVIINTEGEYKELFDLAYKRLEAWTYVDSSQDVDIICPIKEYQFNQNISFYDFIEKVLPKLNVKDLTKWQNLCTELYGLKNKRLFNAVLKDSFDKSHPEELALVCEYLFSKEGFKQLISDFLAHCAVSQGYRNFSSWSPDYSKIPLFSTLPFIQQKMVELHFKPIFLNEHLSLLLRLENAIHEASPE